jgi:hypothetical protein
MATACEEYIPSKMYEYLWTQRPILALVWHNPQMERMLRELDHWAVKADDIQEVAQALGELYARSQRGSDNLFLDIPLVNPD